MDDVETAITFFRTLVEDFLGECPAGLVPDLSTVYGAISTVAAKTKRAKSPEASQEARKAKDKDRELPQVVRKLQAAEMDANIDPTMQRVGELNAGIQEMFLAHDRKPICLMRLLIDRRSFQKTVQNFFCFSFLLKDDAVRVYLDEAQLPVCTPVRLLHETGADEPIGEGQNGEEMQIEEVPDPTLNRAEENKFQTIMMNLTETSWKDLVQTFYAQAV
jgi:anti-sigma28 factor (negative regulator of flagellin synthesis)